MTSEQLYKLRQDLRKKADELIADIDKTVEKRYNSSNKDFIISAKIREAKLQAVVDPLEEAINALEYFVFD